MLTSQKKLLDVNKSIKGGSIKVCYQHLLPALGYANLNAFSHTTLQ